MFEFGRPACGSTTEVGPKLGGYGPNAFGRNRLTTARNWPIFEKLHGPSSGTLIEQRSVVRPSPKPPPSRFCHQRAVYHRQCAVHSQVAHARADCCLALGGNLSSRALAGWHGQHVSQRRPKQHIAAISGCPMRVAPASMALWPRSRNGHETQAPGCSDETACVCVCVCC